MIERRALQRRGVIRHQAAVVLHASRWQRWADALLARYGRATLAPAIGATFRRAQHGAPLTLLWQRADAAIAWHQTFQLALHRSSSAQHESRHLHQHASTLVRRLVHPAPAAPPAASARAQAQSTAARLHPVAALQRTERARLETRLVSRHLHLTQAGRAPVAREPVHSERRRARVAMSVEELVTRLRRRVERRVADAGAQPPAPRVVARPAPARSREPTLERSVPPNVPAPLGRGSASTPAPAHAPVLNLDRIAEQVIDRLDRRITAQRERMGRI